MLILLKDVIIQDTNLEGGRSKHSLNAHYGESLDVTEISRRDRKSNIRADDHHSFLLSSLTLISLRASPGLNTSVPSVNS